ncbi:RING-type domain-containing protein [Psidium guajava]|nr:RING-type domain-containing protein [Psidium guajava]
MKRVKARLRGRFEMARWIQTLNDQGDQQFTSGGEARGHLEMLKALHQTTDHQVKVEGMVRDIWLEYFNPYLKV